ncbi:MAG: c-type cytochrome [Marinomonas sp.]
MLKPYFLLLASCFIPLFITGCEQVQDDAMRLEQAKSLTPSNKDLNGIYQRSCVACHANPDTQAPLTGDLVAWQPRIDKGMETLLTHVVNGFGGMPPFGMCMDCSEEEFEQLIQFMAQSK